MTHNRNQTANHVLMIEPTNFHANPQTMPTNQFQHEDDVSIADISASALQEFRTFRDKLVEVGVSVTTLKGHKDCPDHVFCNWVSTHEGDSKERGTMVYYPMLAENRRAERRPEILAIFEKTYDLIHDYREYEHKGQIIEATASCVLDRVNKVAYSALSPRTDNDLAKIWAKDMGYEHHSFETKGSAGIPLYHTDLVMWIGTDVVACCFEAMTSEAQKKIVRVSLERSNRTILSLSMDELNHMSGNALELRTLWGETILAISTSGYEAFSDINRAIVDQAFDHVVHSDLKTLEKYGGGSARCMLTELF